MREKYLEKKQLEMAGIVKMLNEQIEKLDSLITQKGEIKKSLENFCEANSVLDIPNIAGYKNYLVKMVDYIRNQEQIIENTKNILSVKRMEVNEAYKRVKVLEKLKEKQEKDFYKNVEYLQAKELDDIASIRYHAKAV